MFLLRLTIVPVMCFMGLLSVVAGSSAYAQDGLAAPERPTITRPDGTLVEIQETRNKIIPLSADAPAVTRPYAVRRTSQTAPIQPREPESFPVRIRSRSESKDPGATLTKPAGSSLPPAMIAPDSAPSPVPALRAVNRDNFNYNNTIDKIDPNAPRVRTDAKPIHPAPAVSRTTNKNKDDKGIAPVPPRKPTAESVLASKAPPLPKVPAARQGGVVRNVAGLPPSQVPAPAPPGRRAAGLEAEVLGNAPKVMPALPAHAVGVETLAAVPGIPVSDDDDPLLMQLADFNRESFVRTVEDMTARLAPVPAKKPQRGGMPPPLDRGNAAKRTPDVTATIEKDKKKQDSAKAALPDVTALSGEMEETQGKVHQFAAIQPAAGGDEMARAPIDRKPRPPAAGPITGQIRQNDLLSLIFMPGDDKATDDVIARLDDEVLPLLQRNPALRIQIQAFSSPDNNIRSSARRTALSRALSVREYLMGKGIEAQRMDIRALGMETDRDPLDRIDVIFFDPAQKS